MLNWLVLKSLLVEDVVQDVVPHVTFDLLRVVCHDGSVQVDEAAVFPSPQYLEGLLTHGADVELLLQVNFIDVPFLLLETRKGSPEIAYDMQRRVRWLFV